jgi:hypothetical protein
MKTLTRPSKTKKAPIKPVSEAQLERWLSEKLRRDADYQNALVDLKVFDGDFYKAEMDPAAREEERQDLVSKAHSELNGALGCMRSTRLCFSTVARGGSSATDTDDRKDDNAFDETDADENLILNDPPTDLPHYVVSPGYFFDRKGTVAIVCHVDDTDTPEAHRNMRSRARAVAAAFGLRAIVLPMGLSFYSPEKTRMIFYVRRNFQIPGPSA